MKRTVRLQQALRLGLALLGLVCCYQLIVSSAIAGYSRILSTIATIQPSIEPGNAAVRLTPSDPEAHYTRALSLVNQQRLDEAVAELQQAIRLRPHHYYQWLDLGVTLERTGKQAEADAALRESIRLAPSFAQPHWQLGSLLYREERYREAFEEMRLAARTNPGLAEGMLDLAWIAARGDVGSFEALIQPTNVRRHFEMARFLAKQQKGIDSVRHIREAGLPQDDEERSLLQQTISELLAAGNFSEAFDVWSVSHSSSAAGAGKILNGDFVDPILADDPGFGWQLPTTANVLVSIDPSGPNPNTRSLRLEFSGESPPASRIIHQLVLLPSNSHYSLSFQAKSEKLVTGGPPVIAVIDARSQPSKIIGQSEPLSRGLGGWTAYTVDFSTEETTPGVVISLQRLSCNQSPCPVFGNLWLGGFKLSRN